MNRPLRVVVADDEPELLAYCESMLSDLGHEVVGRATDGSELIQICRVARPDLVITDVKMPVKDGIEAVREIFRESPLRVILVTGYHAPGHIYDALREMVLAYLAKPFQRRELLLAIDRVEQRFEEFLALTEQGVEAQEAIGSGEILRLAKGILMKRQGLDDREAFQQLRRLAQERGTTLAAASQSVIDSEPRRSSPDSSSST
jgi:two-component system, response regulator PdtaR